MDLSHITKLVREQLEEILMTENISRNELKGLERYLDSLFASLDIDVEFTRHFMDRMNDPRNKKEITPEELKDSFEKTYQKYGKKISQLGPNTERVIADMKSDINIPFVLSWNPQTQMIELINKTIMRKKNFLSYTPKLKV